MICSERKVVFKALLTLNIQKGYADILTGIPLHFQELGMWGWISFMNKQELKNNIFSYTVEVATENKNVANSKEDYIRIIEDALLKTELSKLSLSRGFEEFKPKVSKISFLRLKEDLIYFGNFKNFVVLTDQDNSYYLAKKIKDNFEIVFNFSSHEEFKDNFSNKKNNSSFVAGEFLYHHNGNARAIILEAANNEVVYIYHIKHGFGRTYSQDTLESHFKRTKWELSE